MRRHSCRACENRCESGGASEGEDDEAENAPGDFERRSAGVETFAEGDSVCREREKLQRRTSERVREKRRNSQTSVREMSIAADDHSQAVNIWGQKLVSHLTSCRRGKGRRKHDEEEERRQTDAKLTPNRAPYASSVRL